MIPEHICLAGDCLLVDGSGFIPDGIEWVTGGPFSHVAIYVGGGDQRIVEATGGGVAFSTLPELLEGSERFCVRRVPGLTVEAAERMKARAYSMAKSRDKYDFQDFFTLLPYLLLRKVGIRWPWLVSRCKGREVCSVVYAECLHEVPVDLGVATRLVTPDTLFKTDKLITIYDEKL